jgi:TRAP-type C4-dicarboxylate transport system permease small subunit
MKEAVSRGLDLLYLACIWVAGVSMFVMTLVIPWGVYARYVMGQGSQWPEPLAELLMIVFTFAGASAAYRAGAHIAVTVVTDRVGPKLGLVLEWMTDLLMAAICVFVIIWGFMLCSVTWNQTVPAFPWLSVGLTYSPLPVGGILTLIFVLERMVLGPQKHREIVKFGEASAEPLPMPDTR